MSEDGKKDCIGLEKSPDPKENICAKQVDNLSSVKMRK